MLNNIIVTVLADRGKVTLPTIGILVKVEIEDQVAYLFTPSMTKIDSVMVNIVMAEMDMDITEAESLINNYIELIKSTIKKSGKYTIKNIGKIICAEGGTYNFINVNDGIEADVIENIEENIQLEVEQEDIVQKDDLAEERFEEVEITEDILEEELVEEENIEDELYVEIDNKPHVEINKPHVEINKPHVEVESNLSNRLNERFTPKTLGEIIEGRASKRFHDKIHSQVIVKEEKKLETIRDNIMQESNVAYNYKVKEPRHVTDIEREMLKSDNVKSKQRKGIYNLYDRTKLEEGSNKYQRKSGLNSYRDSDNERIERSNKITHRRRIDYVLIISIIVIVLGLCTIIYLYSKKQELGV